MREAEITCLTRMVRIPDLGLELTKGDTVTLSEKDANGSEDLALMRQLHAVQVRWVRRCNTVQATSPLTGRPRRTEAVLRPTFKPVRPHPSAQVDDQPPGSPPPRQNPAPEVDLEVLAEMIAMRLGGDLDRVIAAVRESRPVGRPNGAAGSPSTTGTVDEEMPMFLPSKIVDHDAKADIKTTKSTGDAGGIDDAAAALKKARGGRKRKER